ncbi:hypothetical protein [Chryseobacterium arthrosphaerae]|uniref:hypothetical protein n=1 Tax=Chryseobacterium arthrosphaerae TaxID=651561 RepID=UPI00241EE7A7|nr:hypothetical protein [Chryseobacterium arthrosphaerae]
MKKYAYIGCLGFIAVITTEFGVIGILPQIAEDYKISIDKAGYLLSAFALVIALTGPFMTLLTSGIDRKKNNAYFHPDVSAHRYCIIFFTSVLAADAGKSASGISAASLYRNCFVCCCSSGR